MIRKVNSLKEEGNSLFLKFVVLVFLLTVSSLLFPINFIHAQEISPTAKKNIVQNYKINLSDYLTFGTDCSLKPKGDANCDGQINQFDLSIWEIEFNAPDSPRRSDFNNDGVVNLVDFGVWRNTFYPATNVTQAQQSKFLSTLINLISNQIPITQLGFGTLGHFLDQLGQLEIRNYFSEVYAQEPQPNTQPLNSSSAFVSGSGNSLIINSAGSDTRQIQFDPSGNPVNSQIFSPNGQVLAGINFLQSGTTTVSTQQDGIQIRTSRTAAGAVIEFYNNPDGTLIAIKSWPTQDSYDRNEPPLSVTIPGIGATREVLNIQTNGDGIVEKTDPLGNVLSRNQLRANGTLITEDFQNKTIVQSNSQVGFTTLSMDNNLGGNTQYMFYQGQLYGLVQTKSEKEFYIAKPLDASGNSWSFESNINGTKSEKIVSNPITELNSNTPDPKQLIADINYYKSASPNPDSVNFSDGFTKTTGISSQINKANDILTISQTQAPNVLGIIKEAFAAAVESKPDSNGTKIGIDLNNTSVRDGQPKTDVIVQVYQKDPSSPTGGLVATDLTVISMPRGAELPNFSQMDPSGVQSWANGQINAGNPAFSGPGLGDPAKQGGVNYTAPVTAPQAAPPAVPPGETPEQRAVREASEKAAADAKKAEEAKQAEAARQAGARPASAPAAAATATGFASALSPTSGTPVGTGQVTFGDGARSNISDFGGGRLSSTITDAAGNTIAKQEVNTVTGLSQWSKLDAAGNVTANFIAQSGQLTAIQQVGTSFGARGTEGSVYALTREGNLVAIGSLKDLDAQGFAIAGRSLTDKAEFDAAKAAYEAQKAEQEGATGASQRDINGTTCFLAGTLISTPQGPKTIEAFKPGDKVYSFNEKTGQKEISDFGELDINFVDEYLIINGKIHTTVYHPFYIVIPAKAGIQADLSGSRIKSGMTDILAGGLKTVRADELKIGDILQNEAGEHIPVYSIEKIPAPKTTVYNLMEVSPNNNFFAEGILVHNYSFDTTSSGAEDPNPGGNPYNADGSYTDSWAETGGWNPSVFSASDISPGEFGGSVGGGDGGKSGEGGATGLTNEIGNNESGNSGSENTGSNEVGSEAGGNSSGENGGGEPSGDQSSQSDANSSGGDSSGW